MWVIARAELEPHMKCHFCVYDLLSGITQSMHLQSVIFCSTASTHTIDPSFAFLKLYCERFVRCRQLLYQSQPRYSDCISEVIRQINFFLSFCQLFLRPKSKILDADSFDIVQTKDHSFWYYPCSDRVQIAKLKMSHDTTKRVFESFRPGQT